MKPSNLFARLFTSNSMMAVYLLIFIACTVTVGFITFYRAEAIASSGSLMPTQPNGFQDNTTATPTPLGAPTATPTVPAPVGPQPIPWDGASRVTVLVMGLDYGDWESEDRDGPPRTDTMILLSVDPVTKSAGILNIPRDLWVSIPGFNYGKINTAYPLGEGSGYPGGGPGLAIDTIEQFIGIPINYYALVDFYAFEDFIDEIGGVDINVPEEIKVDPIGKHNTVKLKPGKQTLDGPTALAYARARYTEGGDFDRAQRQQQVILAIRDKVLNLNMLPTLITKAPTLYSELAAGIKTNLTLDEAISLAWLAQSIQLKDIKRGAIAPPKAVILAKSPDGKLDILKPVTSEIRLLRDEIFASDSLSPFSSETDLTKLLSEEGARLSILNGSGVPGLAGKTTEYLTSQGANVTVTGDAGVIYNNTTIVIYSGRPYTIRYLIDLMNIQSSQIRMEYNPGSDVDIVIYLGADWAAKNPLP